MRRRGEDGSAVVEFVWLAILFLVPLVYVVVAVFTTQRTAYAASTAARSAARAFVTAPDEGSAPGRARAAARLAFSDQGIDAPPMALSITCRPRPGNCLSPGSTITATVRSSARLPLVPAVLGGNAPRIAISATGSSAYGTFREDR